MVSHPLEIQLKFHDSMTDPIQHGPFWVCSQHFVRLPVPKIRYMYFAMMEHYTLAKKIQEHHARHSFSSAGISIFRQKLANFVISKKKD